MLNIDARKTHGEAIRFPGAIAANVAAIFGRHLPAVPSRKIAAHSMIWREGEERRDVFVVRSGAVCFSKLLSDGRRVVTGFAYPGDIIGLGADRHTHDAEALHCCRLDAMPIAIFRRAAESDHEFARMAQDEVSAALLAAYDHLAVLSKMTAHERLAHFLVALSDRNRRLGHSPASVLLPMRRIDIADYLGLTIETVSRTFTHFKNGGLIVMDDPSVVFLADLQRLTALASCAGDCEPGRKLAA